MATRRHRRRCSSWRAHDDHVDPRRRRHPRRDLRPRRSCPSSATTATRRASPASSPVEPHAATITVGPIDPASLPADGHRGVPHGEPHPPAARRRLRRAALREPVGSCARRRSTSCRSRSSRRAAGTRPTCRSSSTPSAACPSRTTTSPRSAASPQLSRAWTFFLATRLPFLTATIVPIALGGAVAGYDGKFALGWWLLALVAGCLVHLGLNIANDLFDDASRRRRRQHHADAVQRRIAGHAVRTREPPGDGHGVRRLLRRRDRARDPPRRRRGAGTCCGSARSASRSHSRTPHRRSGSCTAGSASR